MNYTTILYNDGYYSYHDSTTDEMYALGVFLTDIGLYTSWWSTLKEWALANKKDPACEFDYAIGSNATYIQEDENGNIEIFDAINDPDEPDLIPAAIKLTKYQFLQLIDDWEKKVCGPRPQKVIVTNNSDHFSIDTID
jgi:hypothetical protein